MIHPTPMRSLLTLGLVLAGVSSPLLAAEPNSVSTQRPPTARSPLTALDRYVHAPDSAFAWKVAGSVDGEGGTAFYIDLTSQNWLTTN
ncbi:MAG: hypothetical protein JNL97_07620, partial [Verrucomicrobiales bacterium]|nr:hypothetical protein [Verrucomicrobiales bacterium]